ncbi:MAG: DUF1428 domain-containing protein [Phycisphaerae bacterium]|nr:DUF1428 domain-containing protein [Phycisphaerae bacterium]
MPYVDGFILPVPTKNLAAYKKMASSFAKACRKAGVLKYFEAVGDDLNVKFGLPMPKLVKPRKGETIVFAWVLFKSKAHRNATWKKLMSDGSCQPPKKMPFDPKRMAWGGFKTIVGF